MKCPKSLSKALSLALIVLTSSLFYPVARSQESRSQTDSAIADRQAQDADDDELERAVRRALRDESESVTRDAAGREPRLVYLDDQELPSAVRASGTVNVEATGSK